jgi:hypothetical protein
LESSDEWRARPAKHPLFRNLCGGVFELRAGGDEAVAPLVVGMGEDFLKSPVIQQGNDFFRLVVADFEGKEATWGKVFGELVR